MKNRPLKLLIASHACATPQNQKLFALAAEDRGWQVTMCLPTAWKDEYGRRLPAKLLDGFDARLDSFPVSQNGSIPLHFYRGRLRRLLNEVRPDIVYSHNEAYAASTIQWCWANQNSIKRPFGFFSCQNLNKKYPPPFRQGEKWVLGKSSFFFPITRDVDEVHRRKGYTGPSTILPLGYDDTIYRPTGDVGARHIDAASRPFRLLYIGRLVEEKGLLTLAKALGQIGDDDWQLTIAGSGPFEQEFKSAVESHGVGNRVSWLGFVERNEVPALFEEHDTMLLPSETRKNWKEQFGRVIVESIACGTPVIGSDSGEIPNLIRETGGGLSFPEAQPDELASAIRKLMTDHVGRSQMAVHAADYVKQHYTLSALADRFADAIEFASGLTSTK